jgi:hypothetical protein
MEEGLKKIVIACLVLLSIVGCKKGEDDPFLSLRSRDKRIVHDWKLVEEEYKEVDTNPIFNSYLHYKVSDGKYTRYQEDGDVDYTYAYSFTLKIKKDGNYELLRIISDGEDEDRIAMNSRWYWSNSSKKKTGISLFGFSYINYETPFVIKRLTNKELVLTLHEDRSNSETMDATLTFERQD